jgi:pimeloyl-ACP methyl ester carboxylesterase
VAQERAARRKRRERCSHQRIAGSEWILFEDSSYTPHLEEPAAFGAAVRGFLAGVEASR